MDDTPESERNAVTSVYSTRSPTSQYRAPGTPDPIEIPPPDVLMITDRSNVGDVIAPPSTGDSSTLKAKLTFSLLTIHKCDFNFITPLEITLERLFQGEWIPAGTCTVSDSKALRTSLRANTKDGTGSGSFAQDFTFALTPPVQVDYKTIPLRFTLKAGISFNGMAPKPVTCCVAFPSQA